MLCDVFENVRKMCLLYYGLDAVHYNTLSDFTVFACLKQTKQRLDLLMTPVHLLFLENIMINIKKKIIKRWCVGGEPSTC